ncbi:MAG: hypothetical protein KL785_04930 [Brevundimonas sp.]|nr:hypothetical protein [Brevundimonas sp.]
MHLSEVDGLDARTTWWIPAVVSPERDWAAVPGCRRGSRYVVNRETLRASRDEFDPFDSRLSCLQWILHHRPALNRALPGATVRAVRLDRWLLGLD